MEDQDKRPWFVRIPVDIFKRPDIMDNTSAADWRVLLTIAKHQGYQNRRTFPLYVAKTAEEARCSHRQALRSIAWWLKVGALLKTKRRRINVYEIPKHLTLSPGIGDSQRHNTPKNPKRGKNGQYMPLAVTGKVTAKGTIEVTAKGTLNQKSLSEVFSENPIPASPQGKSGLRSETSSGHHTLPLISKETLREIQKAKGREWLVAYMKDRGFPLSLLPEEEKTSPKGEENQTKEREGEKT